MVRFTNIAFEIHPIPGTSNVNVKARCSMAFSDVDLAHTFNLDCALLGDDPIFDEVLHRFDTVQVPGELTAFREFNRDIPKSKLNEDLVGKDEIYASFVLSQPGGPLVKARTPAQTFDF